MAEPELITHSVMLTLGKRLILEVNPAARAVYLSAEEHGGRHHLVTVPGTSLGALIGMLHTAEHEIRTLAPPKQAVAS